MTASAFVPATGEDAAKSLQSALLRILDGHGNPVGVGFLVTDTIALTCAHVVTAALRGRPESPRTVTVDLALPLLGTAVSPRAAARFETAQTRGEQDLALLRLDTVLPGSSPARLIEVGSKNLWPHKARAFGLPAGNPRGVWHSGVLRAPQGQGFVQLDLDTEAAGYRVSPGFSGSPVWDEALSGVVGVVTVAESAQPPVSFLIPTDAAFAAWPDLRGRTLPRSPFRSLEPFQETDAEIFHGRREESEAVARRVGGTSTWTTIVGPSGCGKSSLARAGVLPLRRLAGDCPVVVRPAEGASPLAALAASLLTLLEPDLTETRRFSKTPSFAADLAKQGLRALVPRILRPRGCSRLLVVLDQFEELLDERLPATAVDEFAEVLFGEAVPVNLRVLATLRADFLEAALAHPRLAPLVQRDSTYNLAPMSPAQLYASITKPIEGIAGVAYEPRLPERIMADAGTESGALPLLGFALDELWHKQSGGVLSLRAYEEIGAVNGALRDYAQRTWSDNVKAADQAAGLQLLTQLVRVPIGTTSATRRITSRTELGEQEWRLAQKLAGTRLLSISLNDDGTETVELAHEALITAWDELSALVAANRERLAWRESLRHDMNRWNDAHQSAELLPTSVALKAAQRWLDDPTTSLTEPERTYLQRGRVHRRRRVRRRRTLAALVSVLALTAATIGAVSVRLGQDNARATAVTRSNDLAADAAALAPTDPGLAGQLAIAAYHTSPTPLAISQLYATLSTPLDSVVEHTGDAVLQTATQSGGPLTAAMDDNGSLRIWNTADFAAPSLDATIRTQASAIALAPHTALMAAACPTAKTYCLWSLANPRKPAVLAQLPGDFPGRHSETAVSSIAFSPDGSVLAAAGEDGQTMLWSTAQPAHPRALTMLANPAPGPLDDLAAVAFAPHGALLATTIQDGQSELWNLADPVHPSPVATIKTGYQSIAFSPDATMLAAAGDTTTSLWTLSDPAHPAEIDLGDGDCTSSTDTLDFSTTAFSPDGSRLVFSGTDTDDARGTLCSLSLSASNLYQGDDSPPTITGTVTGFGTLSMVYTAGGALLTGGNDGTVRLWRWPLAEADGADPLGDATWALSPSGHVLAAPVKSSADNEPLGIWDLTASGGPTLDATVPLPASLQSVTFLGETALLTVDHNGAVELWNLSTPRHPVKAQSLGTANFTVQDNGWIAYQGVSADSSGTLVAVQGSDNELHLWRINALHATETGEIPVTDTSTDIAGLAADGTVIVSTQGGVTWWNVTNPAHPVRTGTSKLSGASLGTFTAGGNTMAATTGEAGTQGVVSLDVFDVVDGTVRSTAVLSHTAGSALDVSDDGQLVAATNAAGNAISLWDTSDPGHPRDLSTVLPGQDVKDVSNIVITPNDQVMADWDDISGNLQLWDIGDRAAPVLETSIADPDNSLTTATLTPSGKTFIVFGQNGAYLYPTDSKALAGLLCSYTGSSITSAQWQVDAPGIPYQNPCP